jgi:hypothetical protein
VFFVCKNVSYPEENQEYKTEIMAYQYPSIELLAPVEPQVDEPGMQKEMKQTSEIICRE